MAVGAVIEYIPSGKILMLKRSPALDFDAGEWEPGISGRMKQCEELEDALRRETFEETGIRDIEILKPLTAHHLFRGKSIAENELILIMYYCRTDSFEVQISEEHEEYRWATPEEGLELAGSHAGMRQDIETFIKEKNHS